MTEALNSTDALRRGQGSRGTGSLGSQSTRAVSNAEDVIPAVAPGLGGGGSDPTAELELISALARDELAARWRQIHDRDPPRRVSRELMARAICHHVQVEAWGGLDRQTQRRLDQLVAEVRSGKVPTARPSRIKPGTRLIREWHGQIHEVLVLEEGFAFRGRMHRSLSAIARQITGTSWNGHRFFGLRSRRGTTASSSPASGSQVGHFLGEVTDG